MGFRLLLLLFIALHLNLEVFCASGSTCDNFSNKERIDCHPDPVRSGQSDIRESCLARGCCWKEATGDTFPGPGISSPWCFFPSDYSNYEVKDHFESDEKIAISLEKTLSRYGTRCINKYLDLYLS